MNLSNDVMYAVPERRTKLKRIDEYVKGLSESIRESSTDSDSLKTSLICVSVALENIVSYLKESDNG